jgi:heme-degrading monooxygenase HmoA
VLRHSFCLPQVAPRSSELRQVSSAERARQGAGLKELHLLRNVDDPNEVIIFLEAEDLQRAKDFAASADLREKMQATGVTDRPDIYFLEER